MRPRLFLRSSVPLISSLVVPAASQNGLAARRVRHRVRQDEGDSTASETTATETTASETTATDTTTSETDSTTQSTQSSDITTSTPTSASTTSNTRSITTSSRSETTSSARASSTPTSTSSATPSQSPTSKGTRPNMDGHLIAIIVGAVLGAVVLGLLVLLAIVCIRRRRAKYDPDAVPEMRTERWTMGSGRVYDDRASESRHSRIHGGAISAVSLAASITSSLHGRHSNSYSPVIGSDEKKLPLDPADFYPSRTDDRPRPPSELHPAYRGLAQKPSTEAYRTEPRLHPLAKPLTTRLATQNGLTSVDKPREAKSSLVWSRIERSPPQTGVPGGIFDTESTPLNRKSSMDVNRPYVDVDLVSPVEPEVFELPSPSFEQQDRSGLSMSRVALLDDSKNQDAVASEAVIVSPITSPVTSPVTSPITSSVTSPVTSPVASPAPDKDPGPRPQLYKRESSRWDEKPYRSPPSPYQPYRPDSIESLYGPKAPTSSKSTNGRPGRVSTSPPNGSVPQKRNSSTSLVNTDAARAKPALQQSQVAKDTRPTVAQRKSYEIPSMWRPSAEDFRKLDASQTKRLPHPLQTPRNITPQYRQAPDVTPQSAAVSDSRRSSVSSDAGGGRTPSPRMVRDANGRLKSANSAAPVLRAQNHNKNVSLSDLIEDERRMEAERRRSSGRLQKQGGGASGQDANSGIGQAM